jgi:hypothetical protein
MKELQIVLLGTVSAVVYGVLHDQVTVRVCLEYFTVFHPPVFHTTSPTLLGLGWGVIATWWVGLPLGLLLAVAARRGSRPKKLTARDLLPSVVWFLVVLASAAAVAGVLGWWLAARGSIETPRWVAAVVPVERQARFFGAWWAHCTSYIVGALGGVVLSVLTWRRRGYDPQRDPRGL